ncbi:MAG: YraN family protein [Candidatus Omnitrophica bacterium]|nr:YraN family protein [Candidatus Omnitrophota bacterium]
MGREKIAIGNAGESVAFTFLKKHGYEIIATNVCTPFGELDIVARCKTCTVFVEVKTRTTSSFGPPYLSVTGRKAQKIIQNALFWLVKHDLYGTDWRIDVVSVRLAPDLSVKDIELFENAIEGDYGGYT